MPDWLLPSLVALLGGGGLSSIIAAIVSRRPKRLDPFDQLQAVVGRMDSERKEDRERMTEQDKRIDGLYVQVGLHREYNAAILAWAAAGAPPPPPERPAGLI